MGPFQLLLGHSKGSCVCPAGPSKEFKGILNVLMAKSVPCAAGVADSLMAPPSPSPLFGSRLTALVLKTFSQAQHFIPIDEKNIKDAASALATSQAPSGCFKSMGKLFNNGLMVCPFPAPSTCFLGSPVLPPTLCLLVWVSRAKLCLAKEEGPSLSSLPTGENENGLVRIAFLQSWACVLGGLPLGEIIHNNW